MNGTPRFSVLVLNKKRRDKNIRFSNQVLSSASALLLCSALVVGNVFAGRQAKVKAMVKGSEEQDYGIVEFYGVPGGVLMDANL